MRFLYLDDSGKAHPNDSNSHVVFGGFSVDESQYHNLIRRLNGTKMSYFKNRGTPADWEVKNTQILRKANWKKKRVQDFVNTIIHILADCGCQVFSASVEKAASRKPIKEDWILPLIIQRLMAQFHAYLDTCGGSGSLICDWSSYRMDRHISNCISSLIVSRGLFELKAGVSYASSSANITLQVADLIAGCFRRCLDGQTHLTELRTRMEMLKVLHPDTYDIFSKPLDTVFSVF